jgi:hypothetical protein
MQPTFTSGEITLKQQGVNKERHFVAGQVVQKTVNTLHRGITGDQAFVLICSMPV